MVRGPARAQPDPMERLAGKLDAARKVLLLERAKGFEDSAVFGGLDKSLERWREDPDMQRALTASRIWLPHYASLTLPQRQAWVEMTLAGFERVAKAPPEVIFEDEGPSPSQAELLGGARPGRHGKTKPKAVKPKEPPAKPEPALKTKPTRVIAPPPQSLDEPLPLSNPRIRPLLKQVGVHTYRDALWDFPRRFVEVVPITGLIGNREQAISVTVRKAAPRMFGRRGLQATEALVGDSTGMIQAVWFGRTFIARSLTSGARFLLVGRLYDFRGSARFNVESEEALREDDEVRVGDLTPVYPLTKGLTQKTMRRVIDTALERALRLVREFMPAAIRAEEALPGLQAALRSMHRPSTRLDEASARHRLTFDEVLLLQIGLLERRRTRQARLSAPISTDPAILDRFLSTLPFTLTQDQRTALDETLKDMARSEPMSRLLQGDVGSGKTVVAAACLVTAAARGFQGALMAPTEVLAEQHFKTLTALFSKGARPADDGGPYRGFAGLLPDRPLRIGRLTGSMAGGAKESLHKLIAQGQVDIVIGTHALIQGAVAFSNLGLAIVDEQHRFGVEQRAALRDKGFAPHLLVMTATPIPRTLALAVYGDLDVSTIRQLPPGRPEVKTKVVAPNQRQMAYEFIRKEVKSGRQAFVICPLVEESEAIEAKAAVAEYKRLSEEVFPDLRVGLLHGRMNPREKDEVMERFHRAETDVLVSTAVVEVGIDVPNATVMMIEGADRFGLSQIHQYRGRVGRGIHASYCMLLTDSDSPDVQDRLSLVATTRDGFALAEADLRIRGPGEFFGTRQSGLPDLRLAPLADLALLEAARAHALQLVKDDPGLRKPEHRPLREELTRFWARAEEAPAGGTAV